ncbi:hypothetical protein ACLMJK_004869 [Lecanora helva]
MNACHHIGWFQLSGREDFQLHYDNRIRAVLQQLTNPETQYPSMIFLIGTKHKDIALRQLFPHNNIKRGYRSGTVNLRLDSTTISSDIPLLFADGDPRALIPYQLGATHCHEEVVFPLEWQPASGDIIRTLYSRLIAPMTDVVCVFADDFDGLEDVASFLSRWVRMGSPSNLPSAVRPRVLIVAEETAATYNVLEMENLRHRLAQENPHSRGEIFSSVSILHLAGDYVSQLARYRRLKEVLMTYVGEARNERLQQRLLFSARHYEAFFRRILHHVARSITEPFDFIGATRKNNEIADDYEDHITHFMSLAKEYFVPYHSLASFLASSILMDAYPPGMHKFDPNVVFRHLYRDYCLKAITSVLRSPKLAEDLCSCIEENINLQFLGFDLGFETAAQAHANKLKAESPQWTQLKSHRSCLFCLRRKPEHVLTCEHAICDTCTVIFGSSVLGKERRFEIDSCILCVTKGRVVADLKPRTAGVRVLSVDGGGVRGVVPLEFLGLLQEIMGPDLSLQDFFDQAFGTSSGGLIVLGLFLKHWDVSRCIRVFDVLIRDFFGIHMTQGSGLLPRLRDWFRCWLSDGCYDVGALEASLKDVFGDDQRMFDINRSGPSSTKVAVTATTLSDASTYIFSNYNGVGTRGRECGYKHVRPDQIEKEPFLWEAGRVTSAAPGLFKPASIASLGSFQDGGLKHNNPMDLALWECTKIWCPGAAPDIVLSLGTGKGDSLKSPKAPHFRNVLNDGFVPRLCRSFMSSLDGERAWRDLANRLDEESKADYFRLNVPFSGEEPRLDDIRCIDELRASVHLQPDGLKDRTRVALALLMASFFFELDTLPSFEAGRYLCEGSIRCRNDPRAVIQLISKLYGDRLEFIVDTGTLGSLSVKDVCPVCYLFCKKARFYVRHLEETVNMQIRLNGLERRKLSGFPHSMAWFIHQQRLDSPFGNAEHSIPGNFRCGVCRSHPISPNKKRGRDEGSSPPTTPRKRPRIFRGLRL